MLLFPNALCCSLYEHDERNCICAVTKIFAKFLPANNFCQLLRVTRKRSYTSAGNAQAQLHFRDDQQRAFGMSNISHWKRFIKLFKLPTGKNKPDYIGKGWNVMFSPLCVQLCSKPKCKFSLFHTLFNSSKLHWFWFLPGMRMNFQVMNSKGT